MSDPPERPLDQLMAAARAASEAGWASFDRGTDLELTRQHWREAVLLWREVTHRIGDVVKRPAPLHHVLACALDDLGVAESALDNEAGAAICHAEAASLFRSLLAQRHHEARSRTLLLKSLSALAGAHYINLNFDASLAASQEAIALADGPSDGLALDENDRLYLADALRTKANVDECQGRPAEAVAALRECLRLAEAWWLDPERGADGVDWVASRRQQLASLEEQLGLDRPAVAKHVRAVQLDAAIDNDRLRADPGPDDAVH